MTEVPRSPLATLLAARQACPRRSFISRASITSPHSGHHPPQCTPLKALSAITPTNHTGAALIESTPESEYTLAEGMMLLVVLLLAPVLPLLGGAVDAAPPGPVAEAEDAVRVEFELCQRIVIV